MTCTDMTKREAVEWVMKVLQGEPPGRRLVFGVTCGDEFCRFRGEVSDDFIVRVVELEAQQAE